MPDPYHVLVSEVMLQQTTVAVATDRFKRFLGRWPTIESLASARETEVTAEWAGLGYYARATRLHQAARIILRDHGGKIPANVPQLLSLPGVGPYTASAVAAIAFGQRATVVDGNVERVIARLYCIKTPLPRSRRRIRRLASELTPEHSYGDYAQAMMDLGALVCRPRKPLCSQCPLSACCLARRKGAEASIPSITPKPARPRRIGKVYVARRTDGAWLLERRPKSGLLGGMLVWPGNGWDGSERDCPPCKANWQEIPGRVKHAFTHFELILTVYAAVVPVKSVPLQGEFHGRDCFDPVALPSLMRKAHTAALALLDDPRSEK